MIGASSRHVVAAGTTSPDKRTRHRDLDAFVVAVGRPFI